MEYAPEQLAARDRVLRQANHGGRPPESDAPPLPPPPDDDDAPPDDEARPDLRLAVGAAPVVAKPTSGDDHEHDGDGGREGDDGRDVHGALADGFRPTDVGNANRLVAAADGRARFVQAWGRWVVYVDGRWVIDTGDALVTEAAKEVARTMFATAATLHGQERDELWAWAKRSEAAAKVAAMIRLARGIDGMIVDHRDLDADPMLLNVVNGTIDLRTGELRPHNPDDLLTTQAPVPYDADADAPLWRACVDRWQPHDAQRAYLQRVVGSGITGTPVENFFVNIGDGGNGKSKFFGACANVLGDYFVVPHKSLLVVQRHEQHETVKADLFRTRMAVGAETQQGDRLDEAKIKDITGGDQLKARRMREDRWRFWPTWTLFLHTNHRPKVRDQSEGTWRRMRLIEWPTTIPPAERDPHLSEKLAAEGPGILNWLIEGCLDFQQQGAAEPESVRDATEAWRSDEDVVGRWLADCTVQGPTYTATAGSLHASHEQWCHANGERALSARALGAELERRSFDSGRAGKNRTRTWMGLGLRSDHDEETP